MSEEKISPSFDIAFASADPGDAKEALVLLAPRRSRPAAGIRARSLSRHGLLARAREAKAVRDSFVRSVEIDDLIEPVPQPAQTDAVPIAQVKTSWEGLLHLARKPEVLGIIPNQPVHLVRPCKVRRVGDGRGQPKDASWGLADMDIQALWSEAGTRGRGITVGVVDTGVYAAHPALDGRVQHAVIIDGIARRIVTNPPFDCDEHGTHVCGIIAGREAPGIRGPAIGVAPDADLVVAGALVGPTRLSSVIAGINFCVERGADIVNMSLGFAYYEPMFASYITELAAEFGVAVVVAVGNEAHGSTSCPGNVQNAFSVGAYHRVDGERRVAAFSSGATLSFSPTVHVVKPDIVAPGVEVLSCIPPHTSADGVVQYAYMDGSSMAAPYASGAVAVLLSALPDAPVAAVLEALRDTAAHPAGESRPDNRWGFGAMRPLEALRSLKS